jgi:hypothetical protein
MRTQYVRPMETGFLLDAALKSVGVPDAVSTPTDPDEQEVRIVGDRGYLWISELKDGKYRVDSRSRRHKVEGNLDAPWASEPFDPTDSEALVEAVRTACELM